MQHLCHASEAAAACKTSLPSCEWFVLQYTQMRLMHGSNEGIALGMQNGLL